VYTLSEKLNSATEASVATMASIEDAGTSLASTCISCASEGVSSWNVRSHSCRWWVLRMYVPLQDRCLGSGKTN
jgi:hypothetical protein